MIFNKHFRKFLLLFIATIFFIVQSGVFSLQQTLAKTLSPAVTISAVDENGKNVIPMMAVQYKDGDTAFDVMKKLADEKVIDFSYTEHPEFGAFINRIGGIEPKGEQYWGFNVNGIDPGKGISGYKLTNGDNLFFHLTSWPPDEVNVTVSVIGFNNETIIPETKVSIIKGSTAYDALRQAAAQHEVMVDVSIDDKWFTYLNDINHYLNGKNAYWGFYVNGNYSEVGLIGQKVNDRDHIVLTPVTYETEEPVDEPKEDPAQDPEQGPQKPEDNEQQTNPVSKETVKHAITKTFNYISAHSLTAGDFYGAIVYRTLNKEIPNKLVLNQIQDVIDNKGKFRNVTDLEKSILFLTAAGFDAKNIEGYNLIAELVNHERMKSQGINGPIYALLALDSGNYQVPKNAKWTRETLVQEILAKQLQNGAWSLFGNTPSVDITGMALAALAPYQEQSEVKKAVNQAVQWLSDVQRDSGGFHDRYSGGENCESTAQAIVGLTAVGVDPTSEPFTKNNGNLVQHLLSFQRADGGFAHLKTDPDANYMTTSQALFALVAYDKYVNNQGSIYQFADIAVKKPKKPDHQDTSTQKEPDKQNREEGKPLPNTATNVYNYFVIGSLMVLIALMILIFERRRKAKIVEK